VLQVKDTDNKLYYLKQHSNEHGSIEESFFKYSNYKKKDNIVGAFFDCFATSQCARIVVFQFSF